MTENSALPDGNINLRFNVEHVVLPLCLRLETLEREYTLAVLKSMNGNRTAAAKILGLSVRTLRNRFDRYRVEGYHVPKSEKYHEAAEKGKETRERRRQRYAERQKQRELSDCVCD